MPKDNPYQNKDELRYLYRQKRKELSSEYKAKASHGLCNILQELTHSFQTIVSFWSNEEEVNINPFNQCLIEEKECVLPKVADKHLHLYTVKDEGHLKMGCFNLKEPSEDVCPLFVDHQKIDLLLVPGVVFDKEGGRIGYGGGYYDRLLARLPKVPIWGVCFKEQISDQKLPQSKKDLKVDRIVVF